MIKDLYGKMVDPKDKLTRELSEVGKIVANLMPPASRFILIGSEQTDSPGHIVSSTVSNHENVLVAAQLVTEIASALVKKAEELEHETN